MNKLIVISQIFILTFLWAKCQADITPYGSKRELYNSTSSASICRSCIESSTTWYWKCRPTYGFCWDSSDTSSYCTDSYLYPWSYDNANNPQNAEYLLCPKDNSECGDQTYSMYSSSSTKSIAKSSISSNSVCWYKFKPYSYDYSFTFSFSSMSGVEVEIYEETSEHSFTYKSSVSSGSSETYNTNYGDPFYVLVKPNSGTSGSISFTARVTASVSTAANSSGLSSSISSSDGLNVGYILLIVFGSIGFIVLIVLLLIGGIIIRRAWVKRQMINKKTNSGASISKPVPKQSHSEIPDQQMNYMPVAGQGKEPTSARPTKNSKTESLSHQSTN